MKSPIGGNEIYGELPEVILLPAEVNLNVEDLLAKNKEVLLGLLEVDKLFVSKSIEITYFEPNSGLLIDW